MAKRIFKNVVLAAVLAVMLTAVLIVPALYNAHEASMLQELRQETQSLAYALAQTADDVVYLSGMEYGSRVTLIAPDGTVLFDNVADAASLPNHAERPEVMQAMQEGSSESIRNSDTLSETILYCACRADDGCVLRIGATRKSMLGTFLNVLPLIVAMLLCVSLVALLLARRAAKRIVTPINALNLDSPLENETYDELAPLLSRMHRQHEELDRQMRALESARAELATLMANMREGMILLDKNECVLSINESAARIFHADAEKAVGKTLLSVNRSADLHELVQRALSGEGGSMGMRGESRQYDLFVSPVFKDGCACGAVLLILDVTEHYAAEESRREFTANVSHELKTPLTSISGFAEIIRDGIAQPQDIRHFAGMICKESARLMALVNDILELSRLDEKQGLGPVEAVDLAKLLGEVCDEMRRAAEQKQQKLTLSGASGAVQGYSLLLRELFFNLIDNAVKYTPEGGSICVEIENADGQVRCTVSDNGIGIPKEHQSHVFERFYRVDKSHSRQTGGTGLGLAIVKHVAQIHHAQLHLTSALGEGTQIQVTFPSEP